MTRVLVRITTPLERPGVSLPSKTTLAILALAGLALLGWLNWGYAASAHNYLDRDFSTYWLAGHVLASGHNPYNPTDWRQAASETGAYQYNSVFLYPPWSAILSLPLGVLPIHLATTIFLVLTKTSFVGLYWLLLHLVGWREKFSHTLYLLIALCLLFWPLTFLLHNGQPTVLLLFIVACGIWLITRQHDTLAGLLFVLLLYKPHLALFPLLAIMLWALLARRWSVLRGILLGGAFLLLLSAPLLLTSGSEWYRVVSVEQSPAIGTCPTVWGLLYQLLAPRGNMLLTSYWFGTAIAASLLILSLMAVTLRRIHQQHIVTSHTMLLLATSFGCIASVTIIPYVRTYDQTVLLFAFLLGSTLTQRPVGIRTSLPRLIRWGLLGTMTVMPYLFHVLALRLRSDDWNVFEPILVLVLLCAACWMLPAQSTRRETNPVLFSSLPLLEERQSLAEEAV